MKAPPRKTIGVNPRLHLTGGVLLLALLNACATPSEKQPMPASQNTLDTYKIAVKPSLLPVGGLLLRPKERFVMVNLLVFKDKATNLTRA